MPKALFLISFKPILAKMPLMNSTPMVGPMLTLAATFGQTLFSSVRNKFLPE